MIKSDAESLASECIKLLLQHQPDVFGKSPCSYQENAIQAAQALAAFRKELVQQLTQQ